MKQTAVEWYAEKSGELELKRTQGDISLHELVIELSNLLQQAKEMEKEQIINAYWDGYIKPYSQEMITEAEQYYNETFKSE